MAGDITLNAGTGGATLGTDQVAGVPNVDYQIVKIGFSAAGATPTQVASGAGLPVDGSGVTQPISAVSLPLPTGAATAAKQPALGTAGAASADVISVQGVASMTALKVDGSGVTQPVSGTFWQATQPVSGTVTANVGTTNGLALDASVTGLQVAQGSTTSGEKGPLVQGAVTTAAPTYTTAQTSPLSLTTGGLLRVDASGAAVPVTGTFWQATQPVSGTVATTPPANASSNIAQINGVTPLMGNGVTGTGSLRVTIASDNTAFTSNAAQAGTWTVQPGNTANTTPWLTTNVPGTAPGSTQSRIKAAASTNSTNLKGSAGVILGYALYNNTASAKFFKFYNKATAPTVGTDTPVFTVIIPASGGANLNWADGIPFGTGIGYGITGAVTDADTTNTAADDVHGVVLWK